MTIEVACVWIGGVGCPSRSLGMQNQILGLWLFYCAVGSKRSGKCKVASFVPDPNPTKDGEKISNTMRAMMGSVL